MHRAGAALWSSALAVAGAGRRACRPVSSSAVTCPSRATLAAVDSRRNSRFPRRTSSAATRTSPHATASATTTARGYLLRLCRRGSASTRQVEVHGLPIASRHARGVGRGRAAARAAARTTSRSASASCSTRPPRPGSYDCRCTGHRQRRSERGAFRRSASPGSCRCSCRVRGILQRRDASVDGVHGRSRAVASPGPTTQRPLTSHVPPCRCPRSAVRAGAEEVVASTPGAGPQLARRVAAAAAGRERHRVVDLGSPPPPTGGCSVTRDLAGRVVGRGDERVVDAEGHARRPTPCSRAPRLPRSSQRSSMQRRRATPARRLARRCALGGAHRSRSRSRTGAATVSAPGRQTTCRGPAADRRLRPFEGERAAVTRASPRRHPACPPRSSGTRGRSCATGNARRGS